MALSTIVSFLRSHDVPAYPTVGGRVRVLHRWTRSERDGSLTLGEDWEIIPATMNAARAFLGY